MNFAAVLAQLNDLPSTFTRPGAPYTQLMDAIASSLTEFTVGTDGVLVQTDFVQARYGWLDVWGLLADVRRNPNEADSLYRTRITETVMAWVGTVPAIQLWLDLFAPGGTITENLPDVGYVLTFPSSMTLAQIQRFLASLNRIRPAGVPFTVQQAGAGLFLGTINYLAETRVQGSYLGADDLPISNELGATTNNAQPLLPDLYLTDPTMNP